MYDARVVLAVIPIGVWSILYELFKLVPYRSEVVLSGSYSRSAHGNLQLLVKYLIFKRAFTGAGVAVTQTKRDRYGYIDVIQVIF
jgi:hypothetical protein